MNTSIDTFAINPFNACNLKHRMVLKYGVTRIVFLALFLLLPFIHSSQEIDANKQNIIVEYLATDNLAKAIAYCDSILEFDFKDKHILLFTNGINKMRVQKYDEAIKQFEDIVDTPDNGASREDIASAYNGLGQAYSFLRKRQQAIDYLLKASKIGKEIKNKEIQSDSESILAQVYYYSNDIDKAIYHSKKAIKLIDPDSKQNLSTSYMNISLYYKDAEKLDSAQYYNLLALDLNKKIGDKFQIAILYNNMGMIAEKLHDDQKTEEYYKKSVEMHEKLGSNDPNAHINLGYFYLDHGQYDRSKASFMKALKVAQKTNDIKTQEKVYASLLEISIQEKDFAASKFNQKKRDSLIIENVSKQNEEQVKFINNQFDQTLQEEKMKNELRINKKNQIIYVFVIGFLLLLGLLLFQRSRNTNLKLTHDKVVLEQKVLLSQMNPHFIFNALGAIQNTLLDNEPMKSASALSKFSKLIRKNFEYINKTHITLAEDLDTLRNYIDTQQLRFEKRFEYKIIVDENIDPNTLMIPPILLQPFVENAIEHGLSKSDNNGKLEITIRKKGVFTEFFIQDNGGGYNKTVKTNEREHATDIFINRLKLRKFGEEGHFSVTDRIDTHGTIVHFVLKLSDNPT